MKGSWSPTKSIQNGRTSRCARAGGVPSREHGRAPRDSSSLFGGDETRGGGANGQAGEREVCSGLPGSLNDGHFATS